jgi:hypothetical protein
MPVRYDIAAQVPQAQGGGFDPLNAFATMQAMSYRQQQNALAEAQLAEYQRQRQEEEGLRNYMAQRGVDPMSEEFMRRVAGISPKYLPQLMSARATAQRDIRMGEEAQSRIKQAESRLQAEMPGLLAGASQKQIEKSMAELSRLREVAGNVLQNDGKGFEDLRKFGEGTGWDAMIGDKYDPDRIRALATQAATVQEYLKPQMGKVAGKEGQIRPALSPRAAPVFTETMVQDIEAGAPAAAEPSTMQGRLVTEGLPVGRGTLLTQRQAAEKTGREESSKLFGDLFGLYKNLAERKAMPSTSMTPSESLRAVSAGSRAGQEVARVLDPESQRLRDEASALIDQYIQTKRAAGSISAQEANTIDELERLKSMLGSPRMTIEAIQNILARADKYSGAGKLKPFEPSDEEKKGVLDARKLTSGGVSSATRPPLSSFYGQ